ncbi:hypothetical protein T11_7353 [Trichinella zimbabwensis]|uniref:Uncharacterized protein n=1 Tax=Trichinella zimbabwensis TaxID=268475 RepID=A0A0V1HRH2_9BILA|nr:hypothetical protein T11_7353 [Trichinella zimbabwensis]
MDNGYTRGRGSVRRSAAYGVQQRWVAAVTGRLHRNEIGIEHFLKAIAYTPAPVPLSLPILYTIYLPYSHALVAKSRNVLVQSSLLISTEVKK